jgi:hypothetical protein
MHARGPQPIAQAHRFSGESDLPQSGANVTNAPARRIHQRALRQTVGVPFLQQFAEGLARMKGNLLAATR